MIGWRCRLGLTCSRWIRPGEIPAWATAAEVGRLRDAYRAEHARTFVKDPPEDAWVQLLAASYRRKIICIHVQTSTAQDERLMKWLNDRPDLTHFNFFFSNCADFAREDVDVLFPGAVHRNLFFDLGMTTPKQLESSLHHYAMRHPELEFEVREFRYVWGTSRAQTCQGCCSLCPREKAKTTTTTKTTPSTPQG